MSNAKWCDGCTSIFPEGAEGSESGVGRITVNTAHGAQARDQVRDWCPVCVSVRNSGAGQRFDPRNVSVSPSALEAAIGEKLREYGLTDPQAGE